MSALAAGVVLGGLRATTVPEWLRELLREGLAGVVLFAENTPDVATTRSVADAIHAARPDAIVAVDEEGGDVSRLQAATGSSLPGLAALGVVDDVELTQRCGAALGRLQALAGIDLDLAPDLDVASEPLNPVIGVRSFGADPALVVRQGQAFVAGLGESGVAACAKHFPGHGATRADSHLELPSVNASRDEVLRRDVAPFAAVACDAIMTAHVLVPALGDGPASLSAWSTRLIRQSGFAGPIITDALGMGAVAREHSLGEACVLALEAGADLLCLDAPQQRDPETACREAIAAIDAALTDGRLDPARLRLSAARNRTLAFGPGRPDATPAAVEAALAELAVVGAEAATRALRTHGDVRIASAPLLLDLRRAHGFAAGRTSVAFASEVQERWPGARVVVPDAPDDVAAAVDPTQPVLVLTREPLADAAEAALLGAALRTAPGAVVIHGGVAAAAPPADRLVLAHGVGRANAAAVCAALAGER